MSGFSSLNVGVRALFAAQRSLDVTGQNISNANTDGYSRQRVQQSADGGPTVPAMYARGDGVGNGVTVTGVQRIRDDFLEARAQQEHANSQQLNTVQKTFSDVELVFGEPSSNGLQQQMSDFWSGWDDVANNPTDPSARSQLLERANTLTDGLNTASGQLSAQWQANREQINTLVSDVNTTANNIAQLNQAIQNQLNSGASPNDLMDQRDQLVLQLGEKIGATAISHDDGTVDVTVGGSSLVAGNRAEALAVTGPGTYPGTTNSVAITWAKDGYPATVPSGQLGGMLSAVNDTIPTYSQRLDQVAASLASTVNTQHAAGFDMTGAAGGTFFTATTPPVTASTIKVGITDPSAVAASSVPPPAVDGGNAQTMAEHAGDTAGPDATYRQLVVDLGVQAQTVNNRVTTQNSITTQVDNARQSVSSVSIDEEMTNLLNYQHAYSAAAKYISVIDSTLDTIINSMGV